MNIINTFHAAQSFLEICCNDSIEEAIIAWERYMYRWPELQAKCQEDHGETWREMFASYVFPKLCRDNEKISRAHNNLLAVLPAVWGKCNELFGPVGNINIVIYLGLGNGAGWVTDYEGAPSVLFGLENIADLNWMDTGSLEYLVAHELCHVVHQIMYGKEEWLALYEDAADGRYFRLYLEGFAERYQEIVLGRPVFDRYGEGWLEWCQANNHRLGAMYLERLRNGDPVSDFYGNWNQIEGYSDVGYYLGREFVLYLEGLGFGVKDIARLPIEKIRSHVEQFLGFTSA